MLVTLHSNRPALHLRAYLASFGVVFCISTTHAQQTYVKASTTTQQARFGSSVAMSGDTILVGAPEENSNATGVGGNEGSHSATQSGAAYVFVRSGNTWSQQAYLKASNTDSYDSFGYRVALSGETAVVGAYREGSSAIGVDGNQADNNAPNSGAVYIFARNGTTWTQQAYVKASNTHRFDNFGIAVAIEGDTLLVGAMGEDSNSPGVNGDQSNDNAMNSGSVYVFARSGGNWSQQAYLKASNPHSDAAFGASVGISGDTIVVGCPGESSNSTGVNGLQQINGGLLTSGAAYVFVRSGASWVQQAFLKASNTGSQDGFGLASISGNTIVVTAAAEDSSATTVGGDQSNNGASSSGAAYVFVRNGSMWSQQAYLKAQNSESYDVFGTSVSLSGDRIAIGAQGEDGNVSGLVGSASSNNDYSFAGAVYVFDRVGSAWKQTAYLKANLPDMGDEFGCSVCVARNRVVVGARDEGSNATGINGNPNDDSLVSSGATYIQNLEQIPATFCYGDGTGSTCPCGNSGFTGRGCDNGAASGGASLMAAGIASISHDTLVLNGSFMPADAPGIFLQGSDRQSGGSGITFGHGLLCVGGAVIRLGEVFASSGASTLPTGPVSARIHVTGMDDPGDRSYFQLLYRDSRPAFCVPAGFNLTNGIQVAWVP